MKQLQKTIGYSFKNEQYLKTALTHSSFANERRCKSYERLEFLGDSVLSIIISDYLFEAMKNNDEGDLSRIRSTLVCEETLAELARKIGIGRVMLLGNGEEKAGSRERASILADMFEAVLAAVYLDSDLDTARKYLLDIFDEKLKSAINNKTDKDYKTRFQEKMQKRFHDKTRIDYKTVSESGPEHMKSFVVELWVNGKKISRGEGNSKKEAEQTAAKNAMQSANEI